MDFQKVKSKSVICLLLKYHLSVSPYFVQIPIYMLFTVVTVVPLFLKYHGNLLLLCLSYCCASFCDEIESSSADLPWAWWQPETLSLVFIYRSVTGLTVE